MIKKDITHYWFQTIANDMMESLYRGEYSRCVCQHRNGIITHMILIKCHFQTVNFGPYILENLDHDLGGIIPIYNFLMVGLLIMFYVLSTARSFRDGTPINCPLRWT